MRQIRESSQPCGEFAVPTTGGVALPSEPNRIDVQMVDWLASLPPPVRVHSLVQTAPEIARQVAESWNDASVTSLLLEQLLVGDRAPRLAGVAMAEMLRLFEYNERCRVNDAPDTTWELPAVRHLRLTPRAASFLGDQA